jgi:hypothetical protein
MWTDLRKEDGLCDQSRSMKRNVVRRVVGSPIAALSCDVLVQRVPRDALNEVRMFGDLLNAVACMIMNDQDSFSRESKKTEPDHRQNEPVVAS